MATSRSLQGINWLVRTYGPSLMTACNRPDKAAALTQLDPINTGPRLGAAITLLEALEAETRAAYAGVPWDATWSYALEYTTTRASAQTPISVAEALTDTDPNVKVAMKAAMRDFELTACRFVAEGGVLP